MAELDTAINSWVSRCMDDAGYPHLRHARDDIERAPAKQRLVVAWDPSESIPTSAAEAEALGLLGLPSLFRPPYTWTVEGRMEAFQVSLDSCYQMLDEHLGYDLRARQQSWYDFAHSVRDRFISDVERDAMPLMIQLDHCVSVDYPLVDLTTDDFESMLIRNGIPPGSIEPPVRRDLAWDENGVSLYVVDEGHYVPSPAEVALATTFASCATRTGFAEELATVQRQPRRAALDEFGPQLDQWQQWAEETTHGIGVL